MIQAMKLKTMTITMAGCSTATDVYGFNFVASPRNENCGFFGRLHHCHGKVKEDDEGKTCERKTGVSEERSRSGWQFCYNLAR